jgi:voltage-gated potassium channel
MWCVIVTLATVGYGDFFLKTLLGRLAATVICFWGTFIVSYFVVTVTNMLSFDPSEQKTYTLLQRLHYKEQLKIYAVNVLSSAFKHKTILSKYGPESSKATAA